MSIPSNVELEAELIRREHRLYFILKNFLRRHEAFDESDPRREACVHALLWRIVAWLARPAAMTMVGVVSIIALVISILSLTAIQNQNLLSTRQNLFNHAMEMQRIWIENPELIPYFYEEKELNGADSVTTRQVLIMCEMLADMLDDAAASELKAMTAEGWGNYARDMNANSPAFRQFLNEKQKWYPSISQWIEFAKPDAKVTVLDEDLDEGSVVAVTETLPGS